MHNNYVGSARICGWSGRRIDPLHIGIKCSSVVDAQQHKANVCPRFFSSSSAANHLEMGKEKCFKGRCVTKC